MVTVTTLEELIRALRKLGITPKTHYGILDYSKLYIVSISDKDAREIIVEPKLRSEKLEIIHYILKKGFKIELS